MNLFFFIAVFCLTFSQAFSEIHHHWINQGDVTVNSYQWEVQDISPFDELLLSWNGSRPEQGHYAFYVSVNADSWSPWLLYAEWGTSFQKSFIFNQEGLPVRVYQDAVEVLEGMKATGFRIKVVSEDNANLSEIDSLHVCISNPNSISYNEAYYSTPSCLVDVQGLSQMALEDSRRERLCSPTSTTAVVRFLKNDVTLDPIEFAESCWDSGFDIFGNWVFNVAEAYNQVNDSEYSCWVERYENFSGILDSLEKGFPSVISVRGPLPGSALPYKSGHLLAVIGFDAERYEVICMDPAFKTNTETVVRYKLNDLLKAWERRKNVAYVFTHAKRRRGEGVSQKGSGLTFGHFWQKESPENGHIIALP